MYLVRVMHIVFYASKPVLIYAHMTINGLFNGKTEYPWKDK